MRSVPLPDEVTLPPGLAERVDRVCDRFEAAWKAGHRPRVEDYLIDTPEPERAALLRELVPLEMAYRLQQGDDPQTAEYRDRFVALDPAWIAKQIAELATEELPGTPDHGGETARYRFF